VSENQADFNDIYTTFHPKVHRYLTRRIGETEAEDLTQEVFLRVRQALPNFREDSSLGTWIYRIAANVVADKVRSPSWRDGCGGIPAEDSTSATTEGPNIWTGEVVSSIEQELISKEINECIRGKVDKLPEQSRAVIKLKFDGLKNDEIAELLGISLATVKIRLHRARVLLRKDVKCHL
jgi:RNA polymerase sigma-70 factor (ECF subfamily)